MALATELICHYNWWNEFKNGTEQVRQNIFYVRK